MKKNENDFRGVIVPMITPFNVDFSLDVVSTGRILDTFIEANVSVFLLGTTGESVSIPEKQKQQLIKEACRHLNGKIRIYAGISGNCLSESVDQAKTFFQMGVSAVVAHLPYYYPLESDHMLRYYEQLADNVPCPLIMYNIPATVKHSIPLDIADKLSHHPNIAGIKDSERGKERLDESLKLWKFRTDFAHLTGWAVQSAYALQNGSSGIVPSSANLIPLLYRDLYESVIAGNIEKALAIQDKTNKISDIYQKDRNLSQSIPALKTMMWACGLCKPLVLSPMLNLDSDEQEFIKERTLGEMKDIMGEGA